MSFLLPREKPLHLFLFPLLFILNHFFSIVTPKDALKISSPGYWVFNFMLAGIICYSFSWATYRIFSLKFNPVKSSILSNMIMLPFFFFQDVFLSLKDLRARWGLPVFLVGLIMIFFWLIKTKRALITVNQYLNIVSAVLVFYMAFIVAMKFSNSLPKPLTQVPPTRNFQCKECPDVFLFVLDAHTSNQSLQDYFHYDNSKFSASLENRGFRVADQAFSPYTLTGYSMSATLNFDQIPNLNQYTSVAYALQNSAVVSSFKKAGYEVHNYSLFDIDGKGPHYGLTPSFSFSIMQRILECSILNMTIFDVRLKVTLFQTHLNILRSVSDEAGKKKSHPRFFYAHILAPHPPFVIDENGNEINFFDQSESFNNKIAYTKEVEGLNKLLLNSVDKIIKGSPNAIIIIMGDHGYRYLAGKSAEKESNTVFLAFRGPNKDEIHSLNSSTQIFELVARSLNPETTK
ncbi:MAG: sulfatase-like hydrolase/transferase [Bacteroidetes bacterium]|nr:sulfatase-like hydrolase/transferase [Bacteroidota bacterium]